MRLIVDRPGLGTDRKSRLRDVELEHVAGAAHHARPVDKRDGCTHINRLARAVRPPQLDPHLDLRTRAEVDVWRNIDAVEYATLEWVDWFKRRRLLGPLGYVPPVEFEAAFFSSQEIPAMAAGLQ